MKYFIIGIDGASEALIERQDMPYLSSLLKAGESVELKEDLISRGWVEAYTGKHAAHTKGFYEQPVANGTTEWSKSCSLKTLASSVKPIWEAANEMGRSVGIMNVPTASPTPEVDGFFVGGGGGGASIRAGVPRDKCFPSEVAEDLKALDYILDARVPSLLWEEKLFNPKDLMGKLSKMVSKRVDAYISLNNKHKVDLGFIVFRAVVVVEFLAVADSVRSRMNNGLYNKELVREVDAFYEHFDNEIKRLVENVAPEKYVLISDHSIVPKEKIINFNFFLEELGFLEWNKKSLKNRVFEVVKSNRALIPYSIRKKLKKNDKVNKAYKSSVPFSVSSSAAFNVSYMSAINGVYICDNERFGGSVGAGDVRDKAEEVLNSFRRVKFFEENGIKLYTKYDLYGDELPKFHQAIPEILADLPSGWGVSSETKSAVTEHVPSQKAITLTEVKDDNWTGVKGCIPLFIQVNHSVEREMVSDCNDNLTYVYHLALKELKK